MTRTFLPSDNPEVWFKRGIAYTVQADYASAEECFRRTLVLAPNSLETYLNLGYVLDQQGYSKEALSCYESVLAISPENDKARYNRAIHLLRDGNLIAGFSDYEARFSALKSSEVRAYRQPRWDGSDLQGRSILVYCEQGLGDAIQFSRYVPLLAKLEGRVVIEAQQPLISLLSTLQGVETLVVKSGTPPITDCYIPLLSLPRMFQTALDTVPSKIPYLMPCPSKVASWRQKLSADNAYKIGLVWRGSPGNPMDQDRSCSLDDFAPLKDIPMVSFYNLQVGAGAGEVKNPPAGMPIIDFTSQLDDFSDTAALIMNLDLVITVDTAVAHLSGALGKDVWVLLTYSPDWRWMLNRYDSPWYPTMRLFRQPDPGDWAAVVREVAKMLHERLPQTNNMAALSDERQEALFQNALRCLECDEPDAAIASLCDLLKYLPDDPAVWFHLGRAYALTEQLGEAERCYRQALLQKPDSAAIWFGLGNLKLKQNEFVQSEVCLRKAHELAPKLTDILFALNASLIPQCKTDEVIRSCMKILAIKPDSAEATYDMSYAQLSHGEYLQGFANFEARLEVKDFQVDQRVYSQPRWDGSPLNGKSILVFGEQGMGDVIQFSRYLPLVADRGGKVIFEIHTPLIPLFDGFPGVTKVIPKSIEPPQSDVYIQLLSLPYIFRTALDTIPNHVPYLISDPYKTSAWHQILSDGGSEPRIGLVWRGNPANKTDQSRSCPLEELASFANLIGIRFISLQVGAGVDEANAPPPGMSLLSVSDQLNDFSDTAALIANLDLIIGVDTAVVHLAAALGKPVWMMLAHIPEWRWMVDLNSSPWYPTMRLFRQERSGDWAGVARQIRRSLEAWLAERSH